MSTQTLSRKQARRLALAAQGFGQSSRSGNNGWAAMKRSLSHPVILQIDSVSALVRSHYVPLYSRLGNYETAMLDKRAFMPNDKARKKRHFFEYWAHEASLVPMSLHPLFRWRMANAADHKGIYGGIAKFARENADYVRSVLDHVRREGPVAVSDLADPGERSGPWWGWQKGKTALEYLFWTGDVSTASRRGFERIYDVPDRIIPTDILNQQTPSAHDAIVQLLESASKAMGVATRADLRDYFRLPVEETDQGLRTLLELGIVEQILVEGWQKPAYIHRDAVFPKRLSTRCFLSPFDNLVWNRDRTERLFSFKYRLEFYTPEPKRKFGYYVMPFLLGDRLVGRVDLRANRTERILSVNAAFSEQGERPEKLQSALCEEIELLASWLDLETIKLGERGDLAAVLAASRPDWQ
ncbi:MAG: crosslink repair DNA glycosylase YcaQ family protein [Pseudomonadota bacterium]